MAKTKTVKKMKTKSHLRDAASHFCVVSAYRLCQKPDDVNTPNSYTYTIRGWNGCNQINL